MDLTVGEQLGGSGTGGTTTTGTGSRSGRSASTLGSSQSAGPQAVGSQQQSSSTSTPQIQIVSSGRFSVELAVDGSDISKVALGQTATLDISTATSTSAGSGGFGGGAGFPGGFPGGGSSANRSGGSNAQIGSSNANVATATGLVTSVGRVADASSGVATYPVTVTFDADSTKVFVGSTATAEITVSQRSGVLQIPSRAVSSRGGRSVVTVATDGTADGATEQRTVTTGETSGAMVEITSGLRAGEQVVIELPGNPEAGGRQPAMGQGAGGFGPPGAAGAGD
ncbi:MAG: hypothetical protein R2698_00840 [Microthrixaceae bacterium]